MVRIKDLKGKKVVAKNGMLIGEVEDVELDDNTWAVKTLHVKLMDEIAKLYGAKGGFMTKSVVPLPGYLAGPIGPTNITLKEAVTDVQSIVDEVKHPRGR